VAADDVWVVGDQGTLLRWDGRTWQQPTPPAATAFRAVRSVAGAVYLLSEAGRIWRWDGSAWLAIQTGVPGIVLGLDAFAQGIMVIVGEAGGIVTGRAGGE